MLFALKLALSCWLWFERGKLECVRMRSELREFDNSARGGALAMRSKDGHWSRSATAPAPRIVENVNETKGKLLANRAAVVRDIQDIPIGRMMSMKHADAAWVEYAQWAPELVEQHRFAPLRAGVPASPI